MMNSFDEETYYHLIIILIVDFLNVLITFFQMIEIVFSNYFFEITILKSMIQSSFVNHDVQSIHINKFVMNFANKSFIMLLTKDRQLKIFQKNCYLIVN